MINNNPGPWLGSNPNAKIAGKMANPAAIDTAMFIHTMAFALLTMFVLRSKYEAYVIIPHVPSDNAKNDCPKAYSIPSALKSDTFGCRKY